MAVFEGAGAAVGAGFGAGVVAMGALCGSPLGEQAANSARPAKGVISIKRLRVGVSIRGFLVCRGVASGCQSAMARQRTDTFTLSDPRRHIACGSGFVSVRWCTQLTEVADDSDGSHPGLLWHFALETDNRLSGSEIFYEPPQTEGAKKAPAQGCALSALRRLARPKVWSAAMPDIGAFKPNDKN